MWKVRELVDKATNVVMNYTETEAKVREATNDDPWGPSGTQMRKVLYNSNLTVTVQAGPFLPKCDLVYFLPQPMAHGATIFNN